MKKAILLSIVSMVFAEVHAISISTDSVLRLGLPVVVVETVNGEMPTATRADCPEGCIGTSITDATKVPGRVFILAADGDTVFDSGEYEAKQSGMTIKLRGNSSAVFATKKPYKIQLQNKGDMLGRGEDYADKSWALIRNDWDCLSTVVSMKVARIAGLSWVPAMRFVNVIFNGEFRGFYILTETVKRNRSCRIDVDKSGYIIENDPFWWNEDQSFNGILDLDGWKDRNYYKFTFKYPDTDELSAGQYEYIRQAVVSMEQAITAGGYAKHLDIHSFVAWLLTHDILGTSDSGGSNMFMTKYDSSDSSLFKMSTPWDMDTAFQGDSTSWAPIHNNFYYKFLFRSPDKTFAKAYVDKWNELKESFLDSIHAYLMDYKASDEAKAVQRSWTADDSIYHEDWYRKTGYTVDDNIGFMDNWFSKRMTVLDKLVSAIDTVQAATRISGIQTTRKTATSSYNLLGQKVSPTARGIVITDGRKRLNR